MSAVDISRPATVKSRRADLALAAVLTVAFQGEIWLVGDPFSDRPLVALLGLGMTAPFAIRRRAPLISATTIGLAYVAMLRLSAVSANQYFMVVVILLIAAYGAGHQPDRVRAAFGGAIILVATCHELVVDPSSGVADYIFIMLIIGGAWIAGWAVQQRERRASRLADETVVLRHQRDSAAEDAADQERARIARELHDIISHSVSVMVLQAGAAGEVMGTDPTGAKRSLDAVQQTGRQALVELRRLLGVLGAEPPGLSMSPQPGVDQLPALIETLRDTGMSIDLRVQGAAQDLPAGVDVSAFRIVQEALTNCARHAGPAEVKLTLTYDEDAFGIQVLDTGRPATRPGQPGRGLVGMKERVALHAGRFEAGPDPAGGFAVRAWIPLDGTPG